MTIKFAVSHSVLKVLAASVWYAGVIILFFKSHGLLARAVNIGAEDLWIVAAVASGLVFGWVKAVFLFKKICVKNLKRIYNLKTPKIWQFYRPGFFVFLALMILFGKSAAFLARDHINFLTALAALEISVGTALLLSSHNFWYYTHTKK